MSSVKAHTPVGGVGAYVEELALPPYLVTMLNTNPKLVAIGNYAGEVVAVLPHSAACSVCPVTNTLPDCRDGCPTCKGINAVETAVCFYLGSTWLQ